MKSECPSCVANHDENSSTMPLQDCAWEGEASDQADTGCVDSQGNILEATSNIQIQGSLELNIVRSRFCQVESILIKEGMVSGASTEHGFPRLKNIALARAPFGCIEKNQFFLPNTNGRMAFSTRL